MKSFKQFYEDVPANAVTATSPSSVAGLTGDPPVTPKEQKKWVQQNQRTNKKRKNDAA